MSDKKREGYCRICGKYGRLSFEHVPPKSAFNKSTIVAYEWKGTLKETKSKGRSIQGGAGDYTLCGECNNKTGHWYGEEYVKWARTCSRVALSWKKNGVQQDTVGLLKVYPLRFLKQIVTSFFSEASAPDNAVFAQNNPGLVTNGASAKG